MPGLLWNNIENARPTTSTSTPFSWWHALKFQFVFDQPWLKNWVFQPKNMSNRLFLMNCSPSPSHSNWSEKSLPQFPICLADFCQKSFVLPLKGMLVLLSKEFGGCWRLFGGWEGVGWYWIVLEGEERGCGGVYHPWGNLILRRKPLQVSLNMPHTHIPSKHSRTKGGENF